MHFAAGWDPRAEDNSEYIAATKPRSLFSEAVFEWRAENHGVKTEKNVRAWTLKLSCKYVLNTSAEGWFLYAE